MTPYDHRSITILGQAEADERFGFARVNALAHRHRHVPVDFLRRMVEACELSGWDVGLAEQRYCLSDRTVSPPQGFLDVYRELL